MSLYSEDRILEILDEFFPRTHFSLTLERGDDCAVLAERGKLILSSDIFVENSHFRTRYFSPEDIGHKALAVNLSDLAAAGARPLAFSLCLTLTGQEDEDWLRGFSKGMSDLAKQYDTALSGGDLARAATLNIAITAWGEASTAAQCVMLRSRCRPADVIYLIGEIGLARTGLCLLEQTWDQTGLAVVKANWPKACLAHLRPQPKLAQGMIVAALAEEYRQDHPDCLFSLMDVSDGLARDLPRLLGRPAEGKGADICLSEKMLPPETLAYCKENNLDPLSFAFEGGEDYALLGTCPPAAFSLLEKNLAGQIMALGSVNVNSRLTLNGQPQPSKGFDHFAQF